MPRVRRHAPCRPTWSRRRPRSPPSPSSRHMRTLSERWTCGWTRATRSRRPARHPRDAPGLGRLSGCPGRCLRPRHRAHAHAPGPRPPAGPRSARAGPLQPALVPLGVRRPPGCPGRGGGCARRPGRLPDHWRANALGHARPCCSTSSGPTRPVSAHSRPSRRRARLGRWRSRSLPRACWAGAFCWKATPTPAWRPSASTLAAARRVDGGALRGRYPVGSVLAYTQLAAALELVGRLDEAQDVASEGAGAAARQGVTRTFGSVLKASAARALYQLGRWDEAGSAIEDALRRERWEPGGSRCWPCGACWRWGVGRWPRPRRCWQRRRPSGRGHTPRCAALARRGHRRGSHLARRARGGTGAPCLRRHRPRRARHHHAGKPARHAGRQHPAPARARCARLG